VTRALHSPRLGRHLRLEAARTSIEHESEDRNIGALLTTSLALSAGRLGARLPQGGHAPIV